jgi:glycosyltransferase involved in cell wall biosynthesis
MVASPRLNIPFKVPTFWVPQLVVELSVHSQSRIRKLGLVLFYALSTFVYIFWLLAVAILICVSRRVHLIIAHNSPDLTGLVACMLSELTNIPYIYEIHDLTPEMYAEEMRLSRQGLIFKMLKKIEHISITRSAGNIFVSQSMKEHRVRENQKLESKSIVVYSSWTKNFSEIYAYTKAEIDTLKESKKLKGKSLVLYLGSLDDGLTRRGLDILIKSLDHLVHVNKLTDISFALVGDGESRNELLKLAKRAGIEDRILFLGCLPRREAYKWLAAADVAVYPCKRLESIEITTPNKIFEYMAAGKAIVASDVPGTREIIIDRKTGLLVKPGDPIDLAEKIRFLANERQSELRGGLGLNAKEAFKKRFCWEMQQQKIINLVDSILSR